MADLPRARTQSARTTLPDFLQQVVKKDRASDEILNYLSALARADESIVSLVIDDVEFQLPSFGYLANKLEQIERTQDRMLNVKGDPVYVESEDGVDRRRVVLMDINREPNPISTLETVDTFTIKNNWIFDQLQNPLLNVELDLTGRVDEFVEQVESTKFIIKFDRNDGVLTETGAVAKNEFDATYKNQNNIEISEFRTWLNSTRGLSYDLDVELYALDPRQLKLRGLFSVIRSETDYENNNIWYYLDTLNYLDVETNIQQVLSVGDKLQLNQQNSHTIYSITRVDTSTSNPRITVERYEGRQPIPTGLNKILKIYSGEIANRRISVAVGYDEHIAIFLKGVSKEGNIISNVYSQGVAFYTNDLSLRSNDEFAGESLRNYYINFSKDMGLVLRDLAEKTLPNQFALTPNAPELDQNLFQVVQLNEHLTKDTNSRELQELNSELLDVKNKIKAVRDAKRNKESERYTRQISESERRKVENELTDLRNQQKSYAEELESIVEEISNVGDSIDPINYKFVVKGFWEYPEAIQSQNTRPQEIVQFEVRYKYKSISGSENNPNAIKINDNQNAYFSPYVTMPTKARDRVKNPDTGRYEWLPEDLENPDSINSNQLQITINANEAVEIQVRSISEVGWPDNPIKSQWSNAITINFPEELKQISEAQKNILTSATKEAVVIDMNNELESQGVFQHIDKSVEIGDTYYAHPSTDISSGIFNENNENLSVFNILQLHENRIADLETAFNSTEGSLDILFRTGDEEEEVQIGRTTTYTIFADEFATLADVPQFASSNALNIGSNSRYFLNLAYQIKNFTLVIRNTSQRRPVELTTSSPEQINTGSDLDVLGPSFSSRNARIIVPRKGQYIWLRSKSLERQVSLYRKLDPNSNAVEFRNFNLGVWGEPQDVTQSGTQSNVLGGQNINSANPTDFPSDIIFQQTAENGQVESNKSIFELFEYMNNNGSPPLTTFTESNGLLYSRASGNDATQESIPAGEFMASIHPEMSNSFRNFADNNVYQLREGEEIEIPIVIYFKYFHLSNRQDLVYAPTSASVEPLTKELSFYMERSGSQQAIEFSFVFNIYPYRPNSLARTSPKINR